MNTENKQWAQMERVALLSQCFPGAGLTSSSILNSTQSLSVTLGRLQLLKLQTD